MKLLRDIAILFLIYLTVGCSSSNKKVPVIGFIDAFEDATISQARAGFADALKIRGYSEADGTVKIEYRNAQGSIPTLNQIAAYYVNKPVNLLATSTTLATLSAIQKTKTIPIFAMISPIPARMNVLDANGNAPKNLFGAVEDLAYIDTSFSMIPALLNSSSGKLKVGMIYNQAEPQSTDAMDMILKKAEELHITVISLPVNSSADAQLVTRALLDKKIDAFFALPDNTVFAAFETIVKSCDEKKVPIFTSEAGLVERGAVAAFGADIYQWGYQAGVQAAQYIKTGTTKGISYEMVKIRRRVFNPVVAAKYHIAVPNNFVPVK